MKISNINTSLNSTEMDEKAGIKLAYLTGDDNSSVFAIELKQGQFIPPHYHKKGIETYFILDGQGIVQTGAIENEKVFWMDERQVNTGDYFTINPGVAHRFRNISEKVLRIIATAPMSHSKDDRYFID